eukprot:gnl/MRDRNA2_/MRDRNA2_60853_c0_seq1.p1 gnl/MRDRNA2_/MRDRNA2_60853_c0~~gnl/MRDRNA2_/MRDRNA2_60853_c0_seq1.p1  ORF type:complete len:2005 (+),score=521.56 gnl/MRDRNA2_/MRDRNA2_60853_c0_seq1:84-6098(+)
MAPKAAPSGAPEEDEVECDLDVPEPPIFIVVAHLSGGILSVEDESQPNGIREVEPVPPFITKVKELEDPKKFVVIEREDLALEEGQALSAGLNARIESEAKTRGRAKWNAAKRKAMADQEALENPPAEGEEAPPPEEEAGAEIPFDVCIILSGFAEEEEELMELANGGGFDKADLWTTIFLSGEIIEQVQRETDDDQGTDAQPDFVMQAKPGITPDFVNLFYGLIQKAEPGSALANATICTVPECGHRAAGEDAGDALYAAVAEHLGTHMEKKQSYVTWAANIGTIEIPELPTDVLETRHYKRLMSSVDPSHHDVPLFLHCLTEQVTRTLDGNAQEREDDAALLSLDKYLEMIHSETLTEGITPEEAPGAVDDRDPEAEAAAAEGAVLPYLDNVSCKHLGHELPGNISVVAQEHSVLSYMRVPGYKRNGLPQYATYSASQRSALRNRIYPFLPELTPVETERMLLVHEFEKLLSAAQPERKWRLSERIYHEKIPKDLLVQTLSEAFRNEMFMNTSYYARHDCCLVALHYRALPGRVLWHAWKGDLFTDTASEEWKTGLFTKPSFNDWWHILRSGGEPPKQVIGLDSREYGYCSTVEKLVVPSDGSTILVSTFNRGITQTFPHPDEPPLELQMEALEAGTQVDALEAKSAMSDLEQLKDQKEPPFHPPPRLDTKWSHVLKDGITFGITGDTTWEERRSALQKDREDREAKAKAEAEAAAAEEAAVGEGGEADAEAPAKDETQVPEPALQENVISGDLVRLEALEFGLFWLTFPDGARCTVRMHHERAFPAEREAYDPVVEKPGAALTYSLSTGQVIQVFSDASVCQMWPLALLGGGDVPPSLKLLSDKEGAKRRPAGSDTPHFYPGCAEDVEASRTITAFGTLIRRLISGRIEICHADGTTSARNPTVAEMQQKVDSMRANGGPLFEFLNDLYTSYSERHTDEPLTAEPNETLLSAGLPGHWVVIRPDGKRVGRCKMPPHNPSEEASPEEAEAPTDEKVADEEGAEEEGAEKEEVVKEPEPQLIDLLHGYPVDNGEMIEYELPVISVAQQIDPHTLQKVTTNAQSLLVFEDRTGDERVCLHAEGTRVKTTKTTDGRCIVVEKDNMARITCQIDANAYVPNTKVTVDCADGTVLEVIPKILNEKGELFQSDPNVENLDTFSMNASVLLKRPNGSMLRSFGNGEVDIITGLDVEAKGEKDVLSTLNKSGMYVAKCDKNCIEMTDPEGNYFRLGGDQCLSFMLAVSMGDELREPKCIEAGVPYKHPDIAFLPLPEDVPPPRLIVVYGDGEAEELVMPRVVQEAVRTAKADHGAVVLEGEHMGSPMENCKCHTIFKASSSEAKSLSVDQLQLPPIIAGCDMAGAMGTSHQPEVNKCFTEFRQFVEYPPISDELREKFYNALGRYEHWEFDHRAAHAEIGKGLDAKGKKDKKGGGAKGKDAGGKKKKGAKDGGKRSSMRANSSMSAEEEAAQRAAEDTGPKISVYNHEIQTLKLRLIEKPSPTFGELLKAGLEARSRQGDDVGMDEAASKIQAVFRGKKARERVEDIKQQQQEETPQEEARELPVSDVTAEPAAETATVPVDEAPAAPTVPVPPRSKCKVTASTTPVFSYFESEQGLQFLLESGGLEPDRKVKTKEKKELPALPVAEEQRTPWNPRLVDEPEPNFETTARAIEEVPEVEDVLPGDQSPQDRYQQDQQQAAQGYPGEVGPRSLILRPDRPTSPVGPHPDKKSSKYDVYGVKKEPPKPVPQAYVSYNAEFLEVESAVDRRVRTASIAHKKNATNAPSVSAVRKGGSFMDGAGYDRATGVVGELRLPDPRENWQLTSTMQGLGDPTKLVDVTPGICRFGPLRCGCVYRMNFFLRNLDVDTTRFNVARVESAFVNVHYAPQLLAPGMAAKIAVEIIAGAPARVEQLVEVRVKAHVVQVPVTARVFDADEYDRLDAESMNLHGRHIGRLRKGGPVELVTDESYCRKVLGEQYAGPPPEQLSWQQSQEDSMLSGDGAPGGIPIPVQ